MDEEIQYLAFHENVRKVMDSITTPPPPDGAALESYRFIIMDASDGSLQIIDDGKAED